MRKFLRFPLLPLFLFRARGHGRDRLILLAVFIAVLAAGALDYPTAWNRVADRVNPPIDAAAEKMGMGTLGHYLGIAQFSQTLLGRTLERFTLGLDLAGGVQMAYDIDVSRVASADVGEALESLRDTIERRVNFFGVREPQVALERAPGGHRLLIELAGVKDPREALAIVEQAPFLEFYEEGQEGFVPTGLSGQHLKRADVVFDPNTNEPQVSVTFNDDGTKLFAEITKRNVGKRVGILLDGALVSAPQVREEIPSGQAVITGMVNPETGAPDIEIAKALVRNLNAGALPLPIDLVSQQQVGATLGQEALARTLFAAVIGFAAIVLFMAVVYRVPGLLASIALLGYIVIFVALFKLVPVTLTLAGIAGVVLSIGMAVDANILIFARMREELAQGKTFSAGIEEGFNRAWTSIRDSNISTILTSLVLYFVGTSFVRGFALALGVGVVLSMFTALFVSRRLLREFARFRYLTTPWLW